MNNDSLLPQKITPALNGDELDVLEAGYKLEKQMGRAILTPDQRKMLEDSGRILNNTNADKTTLQLPNMEKAIKGLVALMQQNLIETFVDKNDISEWDQAPIEVRVGISRDFFKLIYGYSPENMVKFILGKLQTND